VAARRADLPAEEKISNREGAKHAKEEFFCWKRRGF
jgi:hypothetical protein